MIGIRREDKNRWERRAPLTPENVSVLVGGQHLRVRVQPSPLRVFPDEAYARAGAEIAEDLSGCRLILGVKEVPEPLLVPGAAYLFFAHVTKGQRQNMPMLRRLLDLGCSLVDYEKIVDDRGRRLIFFGLQAGHSGMIDTLWALGRRLDAEGIRPNPFGTIRPAWQYRTFAEAQTAVSEAGEAIRTDGLPASLAPFVCGFAGYGNTYRGASEVFDLLPVREIHPGEIADIAADPNAPRDRVFKVVFREEHTVAPASPWDRFELQDYYLHPEKYKPVFEGYLPHLTLLMNCVYWEPKYPRLVTKQALARLYGAAEPPRLRVIGDISCDVAGAIECTVRCTEPGDPVFVWEVASGKDLPGVEGRGPVVLAVDNLPCELPADASEHFGEMLLPFVPALARCDWGAPLEALSLPPEILRAVVAHCGGLSPSFAYLESHLAV